MIEEDSGYADRFDIFNELKTISPELGLSRWDLAYARQY
jgi:hypothetical protein